MGKHRRRRRQKPIGLVALKALSLMFPRKKK